MPLDDATKQEITGLIAGAVTSALEPITKRLNGQSALLDKLSKPPDLTPEGEIPPNTPPGVREFMLKLRDRQNRIDGEWERLNTARIRSRLAAALVNAGVPEPRAPFVAEALQVREPQKFLLDGDEVVRREAPEAQPISLDDFALTWLATPAGRAFLPERVNPRLGEMGETQRRPRTAADLEQAPVIRATDLPSDAFDAKGRIIPEKVPGGGSA